MDKLTTKHLIVTINLSEMLMCITEPSAYQGLTLALWICYGIYKLIKIQLNDKIN